MNRDELRRKLRQQRQQLRSDLALMRQRARARLPPEAAGNRFSRRLRRALAASALVLILWLLRCDTEQGLPSPPVKVATQPPPQMAKPRLPRKPARAPMVAKIDHRPRAAYDAKAQAPPTWIDELRLQAAARSPRLAQCFEGADRPGAVRWMAALNPETGAVSDHDLEPLGPRSTLTADQRACVVRALSSPRYHLSSPPLQPFPERVTLVIEF